MPYGLQPGQLVVVAGRPAMGKSTLGVAFARSAALKHHEPKVIFRLEMRRIVLAQRIIAAETNIPLAAMRNPDDIDPGRWNVLNDFYGKLESVNDFYGMLESAPLYIVDWPNTSLMEIRAKCRRLKQTQGLKLVVIDYLQLMSSGKQVESRQQEVAAAPRAPWDAVATPPRGKGVRWAARLTHQGGSAFPGKVVDRVDPGFLRRTLAQLPLGVVLVSGTTGTTTTTRMVSMMLESLGLRVFTNPTGVVLVSGTNGKTTTTRMVSMMLESLGLRVFTNPTGSNFTRGVVSALLLEVSADGALDADIAVLELDEAYAVHFVEQVRPDYALLLNGCWRSRRTARSTPTSPCSSSTRPTPCISWSRCAPTTRCCST